MEWSLTVADIALTGLGPFNYMPAQLQNLLTQQFPDGFLQWGGQQTSSRPSFVGV